MRNRLFQFISIFLLFSSFVNAAENEFTINVSEEVSFTVFAQNDESGLLKNYKAIILTPVCDDTICYPIELEMYWDAIGRFSHFDTIAGKGLTKKEHQPFTVEDYKQLTLLLKNRYPLFLDLNKHELIDKNNNENVDAYTGATVESMKDEIISGAFFSCYTLWHIANGVIIDSIQHTTPQFFNKELIGQLIGKRDEQIFNYILNNISASDFEKYLSEILLMIENGGAYYAKNIIDKIPDKLFENDELQYFFAEKYSWLHYYAQINLLKKLVNHDISLALRNKLLENIKSGNSYHNELIQKVLISSSEN